ncbi:MAG: hypothetical protein RPS47_12580 [Colwellia sp.]|jgi:hypothetical protein
MQECIIKCHDIKKLSLNNHTIFLIDLFFSLRKAKDICGINDIIERIRDDNKFLSSCFELEVANYYLDLGMTVEVVAETNDEKTPDLLVSTRSGKVYVEAKLLEDKNKSEQKHFPQLVNTLKNYLNKKQKCLNINIQAHRELGPRFP